MKLIQIFKNNLVEINCLTFQALNMCLMGATGHKQHNKSISFYAKNEPEETRGPKFSSKRRKLDNGVSGKRSVTFNLCPQPATVTSSKAKVKSILKTETHRTTHTHTNTATNSSKGQAKLFARRVTNTKRKSASIIIVSVNARAL